MAQRYNLFFYYLSPPPKKRSQGSQTLLSCCGATDPSVLLRLYYRHIMHIGPIMHIRRSKTNPPVGAQRDRWVRDPETKRLVAARLKGP